MARSLHQRRGSITVQAAILMVVMVAMVAMAVDVGMLYVARTEMQRTADSSAMAAAWELVNSSDPLNQTNPARRTAAARKAARRFARLNEVAREPARLNGDDIRIGYLADPSSRASELQDAGEHQPNAVRVVVERSEDRHRALPLYFARVLGSNRANVAAEATAAIDASFRGFRPPSDGSNLPILPLALDLRSWASLTEATGNDRFRYDQESGTVAPGSDGIPEWNLYPQDTGSGGNRGTVDIGNNNNSTGDIARQIVDGISAADLAPFGGKLEIGASGVLELNGDPGISASLGRSLARIAGQTRIVPIFSEVVGSGNASQYQIVKFAGVRIMHVDLRGGGKQVVVQPAAVITRGGILGPEGMSEGVYSPARLVR